MFINKKIKYVGIITISLAFTGCVPSLQVIKNEVKSSPDSYNNSQDSTNSANLNWREFFTDQSLIDLIDTALVNNQDLNIILQEINVAKAEVTRKKGEYLPFMNVQGATGVEKAARYTRDGAVDATTDIEPGKKIPEVLPNSMLVANASWEVDIWRKLRNARDAQISRYLASIDGKNFMVTNLIAEIANSYYELLALDSQLDILKNNITIQKNALEIVKMEKKAAKVTELAVRKFEAEVYKNQSRQFYIQQQIIETENKINFLVGRYPQPISRSFTGFNTLQPNKVAAGLPAQLLDNRPDVKQAELELAAAKLEIKVAKANFYPSLKLNAGVGLQAFNPSYLIKSPESMLFNTAGDLVAPVINRKAIKATYYSANANQIQALYNYEKTILNAFLEVTNKMSNIYNLEQSYALKEKQVEALTRSITISNFLFKSARADYMEVLMTQRDALEAKFELIETKKKQMHAMVNVYKSLGGGWK